MRLERLEEAIAGVDRHTPQLLTAMKKLLTAAEFREYRQRLEHMKITLLKPGERSQLAAYNSLLRKGDRLYARAAKRRVVGQQAHDRSVLLREAQATYVRAHDVLGDLLAGNASLLCMFNRARSEDVLQTDEPESMPRRMKKMDSYSSDWDQAPIVLEYLSAQRDALTESLKAAKLTA